MRLLFELFPGLGIRRKIKKLLDSVERKLETMSQQMDKLAAEVKENSEVIAGAVLLLTSLAQQIRDAKDDPVALEKLANDLDASTNSLAAAVAANTIAEDDPVIEDDDDDIDEEDDAEEEKE